MAVKRRGKKRLKIFKTIKTKNKNKMKKVLFIAAVTFATILSVTQKSHAQAHFSALPAPDGSTNGQVLVVLNGGIATQDSLPTLDSLVWKNNENGSGAKTATPIQNAVTLYASASTTSGIDTVFLTTTGDNDGAALFADANYSVSITPPSEDSVSYSYNVTKAQKYVRLLVRSNNILNHWALATDGKLVGVVVIGKRKD